MLTPEQRRQWGLHTPSSLKIRAQELGAAEYWIKGIIPRRSISILVGDSGLGKSPLIYQAAICIAAGVPFLGHETTQGSVLVADFENGFGDMDEMIDQLSCHLGLDEAPRDNLALFTLNDCNPRYGQPGNTLFDMLHDTRPNMVIIDSLASFAPGAEEKNSAATEMVQKFRALLRDCGTASMFVHHRRKESRKPQESAGPLTHANLRSWFQDARGASALINGVDVRLGVDISDLSPVTDECELVLRGFGRVRGEIGPFYLTRDHDEEKRSKGYRPLSGPQLLFNAEQEKAYEALPARFSFKQAKQIYGRQDQATLDMLRKCEGLRLVRKVARGQYARVSEGPGTGVDGVST